MAAFPLNTMLCLKSIFLGWEAYGKGERNPTQTKRSSNRKVKRNDSVDVSLRSGRIKF